MKARDVMTAGAEFMDADGTVAEAAARLARLGVGAMPVCAGGHLQGMITDRDIVVQVVGADKDAATTKVRDVRLHSGHYHVVTVGADDPVEEVIKVMEREQVRRLPVVDGTDLVGIISQADLARQCPPAQVGRLLAAISS